jgi:alpha-tubulin suppressor-like RCC1 family protein
LAGSDGIEYTAKGAETVNFGFFVGSPNYGAGGSSGGGVWLKNYNPDNTTNTYFLAYSQYHQTDDFVSSNGGNLYITGDLYVPAFLHTSGDINIYNYGGIIYLTGVNKTILNLDSASATPPTFIHASGGVTFRTTFRTYPNYGVGPITGTRTVFGHENLVDAEASAPIFQEGDGVTPRQWGDTLNFGATTNTTTAGFQWGILDLSSATTVTGTSSTLHVIYFGFIPPRAGGPYSLADPTIANQHVVLTGGASGGLRFNTTSLAGQGYYHTHATIFVGGPNHDPYVAATAYGAYVFDPNSIYGCIKLTEKIRVAASAGVEIGGHVATTGTVELESGELGFTEYGYGKLTCLALTISGTTAKRINMRDHVYITDAAGTCISMTAATTNVTFGDVFGPYGSLQHFIFDSSSGSAGARETDCPGTATTGLAGSTIVGSAVFQIESGGTFTIPTGEVLHGIDLSNFTGTLTFAAGSSILCYHGINNPTVGVNNPGYMSPTATITMNGTVTFTPHVNADDGHTMYLNTYDPFTGNFDNITGTGPVTFADTNAKNAIFKNAFSFTGGDFVFASGTIAANSYLGITAGTLDPSFALVRTFATAAGRPKIFDGGYYTSGSYTYFYGPRIETRHTSGTVINCSVDAANTSGHVELISNASTSSTLTVNQGQNANLYVHLESASGTTSGNFATTAGDYYSSISHTGSKVLNSVFRYIRHSLEIANTAAVTGSSATVNTVFIGGSSGLYRDGILTSQANTVKLITANNAIRFPIMFGNTIVANTDLNVTIQRLNTTERVTFNSANVVISEMANVGTMTIGYRTYANGVVIPNNITFPDNLLKLNGDNNIWIASNTGGSLTITNPTLTMNVANATSVKTFAGGSLNYGNVDLVNGGNGAFTITGNNTFKSISTTVRPATFTFESGSTQTVTDVDIDGASAASRVIIGSTSTTAATLAKAGGGIIRTKYLSISNSTATPANTWYTNALTSIQGTGVTGWVFEIPDFNATGYTTVYNGVPTDLANRYVKKTELIDRYPSLASYVGGKIYPGLWGWGRQVLGTLGTGTSGVYYSSPIQVGSLTNWKQVVGTYSAHGIRTDGTLWSWGTNDTGQLGNGTFNIHYSSPIQIGALTDWNQVAVDEFGTAFGIRTNGTLWAWGDNTYGQLGRGLAVALNYSSPVQIGALTTWKKVDSCHGTVLALTTGGTMFAWGDNGTGELGRGNVISYSSPVQIGALTTWKDISVGEDSAYAIKTDGTLWAWGYNLYGQLGNSNIINYSSPIQIGSLADWKSVAAGVYSVAAVKTDGTLWTWGWGDRGQLGNGGIVSYSSPIQIGSLTNWKQVASGDVLNICMWSVKTDGTLWAWGQNQYGQLGLNNTVYYSSPVQVGSLNGWKSISRGLTPFAILDGYQ